MKKILYSFILIFASSIVFISCQKDFLETAPTDAVSADGVTATTDNAWGALNGIHRSLYVRYQERQGNGGLGGIYIVVDCQAEDHVVNARQWYRQVYQWDAPRNPTHYYNSFPYRMFYQLIANANILINGVDENTIGPDEDKDAIIGQALLYRAFSHYELVQFYGGRYVSGGSNTQLGVPLVTEVFTTESVGQPRATVEEVYAKINEDIDRAILLLDDGRRNKSHLNIDVARGLKARVALTQGDYPVAIQYADLARTSDYSLMDSTTYAQGFRINSESEGEYMWSSQITEDQTDKWANYGAYMSRNFSSAAIRGNPRSISSLLYDLIADTDVRKTLWDPTGKHLNLPDGISLLGSHKTYNYTSQKFIAVSSADSRVDVPHMRVSEMYLIEAEAQARRGNDAEAAAALYTMVVARDPSYVLSTNTGQDLIDEIMIHRRVELWGEGFRWFDLKRLNLPLDRNGANHDEGLAGNVMTVPAGDVMWQWLIPQDEINANPNLDQNPL